jgi:hypothetical protein
MTARTDREEEFHPTEEKNQPKTCLFFRAGENCFSLPIGQTTNLMCDFVTMSATISTLRVYRRLQSVAICNSDRKQLQNRG